MAQIIETTQSGTFTEQTEVIITHNMGVSPDSITVVDQNGFYSINYTITYDSANQLTISMDTASSGTYTLQFGGLFIYSGTTKYKIVSNDGSTLTLEAA